MALSSTAQAQVANKSLKYLVSSEGCCAALFGKAITSLTP